VACFFSLNGAGLVYRRENPQTVWAVAASFEVSFSVDGKSMSGPGMQHERKDSCTAIFRNLHAAGWRWSPGNKYWRLFTFRGPWVVAQGAANMEREPNRTRFE
jgi:hypothetical protein